jgi:hypothetical protein
MLPIEYWIIVFFTAIAVVASVVLHYEGLLVLGRLKIDGSKHRQRIIFMILGILVLHILEIWIFAATYRLLLLEGDFGGLEGIPGYGIFDLVYFSSTVFTTLGFGDIVPYGPIRFVTGTQSVAGLTLITWSASFTFIEMTKAGVGRSE